MLFTPDEINPAPAASSKSDDRSLSPTLSEASGETHHLIGTRGQKLQEALAGLKHNMHLHFPSYAMWSSHEVLSALLDITGPVDIHMTSWSIAENPVRQLIRMIDSGKVLNLTCLFHERTPKNHPAAWQLLQRNVARVRLVKIHAKQMVLINKDWGISVVCTANFNRNKNIERYVICTHRNIAEADAAWINEVYERGAPFS